MRSHAPWLLGAAALTALAFWGGAALWVMGHPPALSSDDALFFLRGLTRFSILDFSPQFPGYPGFVVMGRGLAGWTGAPLSGLASLGATMALALPWIGGAIAYRASSGPMRGWMGIAAFLLLLTMPLGPDLALSLLSDGAGILFILLGLALLPRPPDRGHIWPLALAAGLALGWALACRPSNLVMALALAAGATAAAPRHLWPIWLGGLFVLVPVAATLLVLEPLYLTEAQRFTRGHAEIWGNVALSGANHSSWWDTARAHPLMSLTLCIEALAIIVLAMRGPPATRVIRWALAAGFLGHAVWILGFQNPESLRHLAPLMVLGPLGPALLLERTAAPQPLIPGAALMLILMQTSTLMSNTNWESTTAPPLMRAAKAVQAEPEVAILITNHGVELMRATLPDRRVHDAYYAGSAALAARLAEGPVWRLSSTPLPDRTPENYFAGRFIGERSMWLYVLE